MPRRNGVPSLPWNALNSLSCLPLDSTRGSDAWKGGIKPLGTIATSPSTSGVPVWFSIVRYVGEKLIPIAALPPEVPAAPASTRVPDEQPACAHAARNVNDADRTNPRETDRHRMMNLLQVGRT